MTRIEHIALWTEDLESMKNFYCSFFKGKAGCKYYNEKKNFSSYFITFKDGPRLELMSTSALLPDTAGKRIGYVHIAFSTGSQEAVDSLTMELTDRGYQLYSPPRFTGDGYYESAILDPDGNIVEICE